MQLLAHINYLKGSALWAEGQCHRAFSGREHYYTFDRFPPDELLLPLGKATAVESIVYWADDITQVTLRGPTSTIPGTDYQEDLRSDAGGILKPAVGSSWPSANQNYINPIEITFTAGYSPYAPEDAQNAMLMYAADRLDIATQNDAVREYESPVADRLLQPFILTVFS